MVLGDPPLQGRTPDGVPEPDPLYSRLQQAILEHSLQPNLARPSDSPQLPQQLQGRLQGVCFKDQIGVTHPPLIYSAIIITTTYIQQYLHHFIFEISLSLEEMSAGAGRIAYVDSPDGPDEFSSPGVVYKPDVIQPCAESLDNRIGNLHIVAVPQPGRIR